MGPPSEQLIRDYLNRLSISARSRLGHQDRQALVERTRTLIELQVGQAGMANPPYVQQVLSWLGDPAALVDLECQRLTSERDVTRAGAAEPPKPPPAPVPPPGRPRRPRTAAPVVVASRPGAGRPPGRPARSADGAKPARSADVTKPARSPDGTKPARSPDGTKPAPDSAEAAPGATAGPGSLTGAGHVAAGRLAARAGALARANPGQALALLLMGVGGPIYPPVWVLGATVVALSRAWDLLDKWIGLALPVLLVLVGAIGAVALGGQRSVMTAYAAEAWVAAGRLARAAAVLSAVYLLWRLRRGPRQPKPPPWNQSPGRSA